MKPMSWRVWVTGLLLLLLFSAVAAGSPRMIVDFEQRGGSLAATVGDVFSYASFTAGALTSYEGKLLEMTVVNPDPEPAELLFQISFANKKTGEVLGWVKFSSFSVPAGQEVQFYIDSLQNVTIGDIDTVAAGDTSPLSELTNLPHVTDSHYNETAAEQLLEEVLGISSLEDEAVIKDTIKELIRDGGLIPAFDLEVRVDLLAAHGQAPLDTATLRLRSSGRQPGGPRLISPKGEINTTTPVFVFQLPRLPEWALASWQFTLTDSSGDTVFATTGQVEAEREELTVPGFIPEPGEQYVWEVEVVDERSGQPIGKVQTASFSAAVAATNMPPAVEIAPVSTAYAGEAVLLSGYGFDPEDGEIPAERLEWKVDGVSFQGADVEYTFFEPGTYSVTLTATDSQGEKATARERITVTERPVMMGVAENEEDEDGEDDRQPVEATTGPAEYESNTTDSGAADRAGARDDEPSAEEETAGAASSSGQQQETAEQEQQEESAGEQGQLPVCGTIVGLHGIVRAQDPDGTTRFLRLSNGILYVGTELELSPGARFQAVFLDGQLKSFVNEKSAPVVLTVPEDLL